MSLSLPVGFSVAGVHCGIKKTPQKEDLSLVVSDRPAVAAGVYTRNLVHAAPVAYDRARTPSDSMRVVVTNSGNANACTGDRGMADAAEMARLAATAIGATADQALVLSTGVIGVFLPLEKIAAGIAAAAPKLATDEASIVAAARGMMTTDAVHKVAAREVKVSSGVCRVLGMCKGAAMIGPNMGTMLAVVMTDAALTRDDAQALLAETVEETFNCISVEGHMSTNDTVLLLANGAACPQGSLIGPDLRHFATAFKEVCTELARAIPNDGEGATHLITIDVVGCRTRDEARKIARQVADSALVKTAIHGADPNWGRIVSATGYAGVAFDPMGVELELNGFLLYRNGTPVAFDAPTVSRSIRDNKDTHILLRFREGPASIRFWTADLTEEYVHLNADYTT